MRLSAKIVILLVCAVAACIGKVSAQGLRFEGVLIDSADKMAVSDVYVSLWPVGDAVNKSYTISDIKGHFVFNLPDTARSYYLSTNDLVYNTLRVTLKLAPGKPVLQTFLLAKKEHLLTEMVITEKALAIIQKDDTIEYNADSYKVHEDAYTSELLSKLPGILIEGGIVKAQGVEVKKLTIDGKDYLNGNVLSALKALPADIINKVQVFDYTNTQDAFTGFTNGNNGKAINITTKKNMRQGVFGTVYAGYGYLTESRYNGGFDLNYFNNDRRLTVTGNSTNCMPGQASPKSFYNLLSMNYNDVLGPKKKVQFTVAYGVNVAKNYSYTNTARTYVADSAGTETYNQNEASVNTLQNHKLNFRFDYTIDPANSLTFAPRFGFDKNVQNYSMTSLNTEGNTTGQSALNRNWTSTDLDMNTEILYLHRFAKKRRAFSANLLVTTGGGPQSSFQNSSNSLSSGSDTLADYQKLAGKHLNINVSAKVVYDEPVGPNGLLQVSYLPAFNNDNISKLVWDYNNLSQSYSLPDSAFSGSAKSSMMVQEAGLGYRFKAKKVSLTASINVQYSLLWGQQFLPVNYSVNRGYVNPLPTAFFSYNTGSRGMFKLSYATAAALPSFAQLQNVIDNSNPVILETGNPALKQAYTNSLTANYDYINAAKGLSVLGSLSGSYTANTVSTATIWAANDTVIGNGLLLSKGTSLTMPVNLHGSYTTSATLNTGIELTPIKCRLNLGGGVTYGVTPGLVNNLLNQEHAYRFTSSVLLTSYFSRVIDFDISYNCNFNAVDNSLSEAVNSRFFAHYLNAGLNWFFYKGFTFNTNIQNDLTTGYGQGFNQNTVLWNASLGYKFLKDGVLEINVAVNDLLNQNSAVSRVVTSTYTEDSKSDVIKRYLLLTLKYRPKFFKQPAN